MKKRVLSLAIMTAISWSGVSVLSAQETPKPHPPTNPLSSFERLIGGQWHLDDAYQEFEWGVGRRSVNSKAYMMVGGEVQLVAEGFWFWHPKEQQIRGVFNAVGMPAVLFDYTTRFEGEKMVSDLLTFDASGTESEYVEVWDLVDDTHYLWTLFLKTPEGRQEVMGGTYERR